MNWGKEDYDNAVARMRSKIPVADKKSVAKKTTVKVTEGAKGLEHVQAVLNEYEIPFVVEHRFTELRMWRFDIAIEKEELAVEYDGLFSKKSRHTTSKGFSEDANKLNFASAKGWTVFRYTAINYNTFELDLLRFFYNKYLKK